MLAMKESFSTLKNFCYLCQARDLNAWKQSIKDENVGELFDGKGYSQFFDLPEFCLNSLLPDIGHMGFKGVFLEQAKMLFLIDKRKDNLKRRVFNQKEWTEIDSLVQLYPTDRDMPIKCVSSSLKKFKMAQVLSWIKMAPVILAQFPKDKTCECQTSMHSPAVRPIPEDLRRKARIKFMFAGKEILA